MVGKIKSHSELKVGGAKLIGEKTDKRIIVGGAFLILIAIGLIYYVVMPYIGEMMSKRNPELDNIITIETGKETAMGFIPVIGEELTEQQKLTLDYVGEKFNDPIMLKAVYDGTSTKLNPKGVWVYVFVDNGTYTGVTIKVDADTNELVDTPLKYTPKHRANDKARNRFTDIEVVKIIKEKTGNSNVKITWITYLSDLNIKTENYVRTWNVIIENSNGGMETYQLDDVTGTVKGPF